MTLSLTRATRLDAHETYRLELESDTEWAEIVVELEDEDEEPTVHMRAEFIAYAAWKARHHDEIVEACRAARMSVSGEWRPKRVAGRKVA